MTVECDICGETLRVPGALCFTPPDDDAKVRKFHWCSRCWRLVIGLIEAVEKFGPPPRAASAGSTKGTDDG